MNTKLAVLYWTIMLGSAIASTIFTNNLIDTFGTASYANGVVKNANGVIDILHSLNNEEEKKNETL